ncbi:type II toxin-antitoxin system HicA family toxin [Scytonema sp. UIC 10036]|uniref:type II toxin-antitoxin system HicA family toxin n=1 Tax=Scytonema sp. UIC 10036 TaxID=2304196 RepID=UPI00325AA17D
MSQKGSHRKWRNEQLGVQVIVPEHRGRTLPIGTMRSIFLAAKIPESEWRS